MVPSRSSVRVALLISPNACRNKICPIFPLAFVDLQLNAKNKSENLENLTGGENTNSCSIM